MAPTTTAASNRGATLVEAALLIGLIASVSILAISNLGDNTGSLESANETLATPDMAMIDSNSDDVVSGGSGGEGGTGGTDNGSAFGVAGAAIQGVDVEDRGFEDDETRNWFNYSAGQTIGAWTVIEGDVDTHSTIAYDNGFDERFIDLNGFGPGAIAQDIAVVPGVGYRLSVTVSENQCKEAVKSMEIEWNGTIVADLQVDLPKGEYRTYEIDLPASANPTGTLVFRGTSNANCGVQIDEPTIQLAVA